MRIGLGMWVGLWWRLGGMPVEDLGRATLPVLVLPKSSCGIVQQELESRLLPAEAGTPTPAAESHTAI
jgi:hypothetical protein